MTQKIKIYSAKEIALKEFPIKKFFLKPLFFPGSLTMLYASPGIGKTFTALWMAAAVAGEGYFLKWKSEAAGRVLYVDGEMGLEAMQERLTKTVTGIDFNFSPENLSFICPDDSNQGEVPLISDIGSHKAFLAAMENRDVIFFDNYDSLTSRSGRESDEDVWAKSWKLIKQLRAKGKSIVIIHHAGKGGNQLGTSKKEQPLNWMIELKRPATYTPSLGAQFELKFTKVRGIKGPDVDSLLVNLTEHEKGITWEWKGLESETQERIQKMKDVGMTDSQIAEETGTTLFFVKSVLNKKEIEVKDVGSTYYYQEKEDLF